MLHVAPEIRDRPSYWYPRGLSLQALRRTSSCFLLNRFVHFVDFHSFILKAKRFKSHRKKTLQNGDRPPSQKKFHGRAANAALTRTHAASRLQLGVGPACVAMQAAERDILTPADDRVRPRKRTQLPAERKRFFHAIAEGALRRRPLLQWSAADAHTS